MSTQTAPDREPATKGVAGAVIRKVGGMEESRHDRMVKKYLPAWVISGAIHVAVIVIAFKFIDAPTPEAQAAPSAIDPNVNKEPPPPPPLSDPTNPDVGLKANVEANWDTARIEDKTAIADVTEDKTVGNNVDKADNNADNAPGIGADLGDSGFKGDVGNLKMGDGGGIGMVNAGYIGRTGATRERMVANGGGNQYSELAVARGLAWLAKQMKTGRGPKGNALPQGVGYWQYDGSSKPEVVAATGMALLPFLAAGETHKTGKRYRAVVDAGLKFLILSMDGNGKFNNGNMYAHGIATMALCEAYGMTKDKHLLLVPAQRAVNFLQQAQGADGSWGYSAGSVGDTSIVGWQIQALRAAQLSKDLRVNDVVVKKAMTFLDRVGSGDRSLKSYYGYNQPTGHGGTSLTAVGLLCRYYMDGWDPQNAALAQGTISLFGARVPNPSAVGVTRTNRRMAPKISPNPTHASNDYPARTTGVPDMYYYYYATQVAHFFEGPEWKEWNQGPQVRLFGARVRAGGMRDWLTDLQSRSGKDAGSWEPDKAFIGQHCGRLGTTCLCLLTLEVYYRHLPLYKRKNTEAVNLIDGIK